MRCGHSEPADGRRRPNLDCEEHRIRRACEHQNAVAACNNAGAACNNAGAAMQKRRCGMQQRRCSTKRLCDGHDSRALTGPTTHARPLRERICTDQPEHRTALHATPPEHTCTGDSAKLGLAHRQQPRAIDAVRDEIRLVIFSCCTMRAHGAGHVHVIRNVDQQEYAARAAAVCAGHSLGRMGETVRRTARRSIAQHSTVQHSTAWRGTAWRSTAKHGTAQHSGMIFLNEIIL